MRVLLICPRPKLSSRSIFVPLGILSIATYLIEKGHTVKFIDRSVYKYDVNDIIRKFKPELVGISMMTTKAIRDALMISKLVKRHNIPVVWGGTLTSSSPELVLESGVVDYVVMGEGEITMLELMNSIMNKVPPLEVDGLAFVENGKVVINNHRQLADLSDLPIIDWSLIDPSKYFRSFFACKKMLYLYGSKGCPGRCTFCTNEEYNRGKCRSRPIKYLLAEIEYLVNSCGMDGIYFTDEYCCKTKSEMFDFCDQLKNTGLKFVWGATTKINGFSEEDFKYMYDSGCRWLFFGIESGSEERLVKIKKGIDHDKIVSTVTNCCQAGIVAITGFIIGFPDESIEELSRTLELALSMPFSMPVINIFIPLPGSELYKTLKAEGRFKQPLSLTEMAKITPFEEVVKNFSNIPTRDLKVIKAYFMLSVFTRRKPSKETRSFGLALKVLGEQLRDMGKDGFIQFFRNFVSNAITFLSYIYYSLFFPRIIRKYGLNLNSNAEVSKKPLMEVIN